MKKIMKTFMVAIVKNERGCENTAMFWLGYMITDLILTNLKKIL